MRRMNDNNAGSKNAVNSVEQIIPELRDAIGPAILICDAGVPLFAIPAARLKIGTERRRTGREIECDLKA